MLCSVQRDCCSHSDVKTTTKRTKGFGNKLVYSVADNMSCAFMEKRVNVFNDHVCEACHSNSLNVFDFLLCGCKIVFVMVHTHQN